MGFGGCGTLKKKFGDVSLFFCERRQEERGKRGGGRGNHLAVGRRGVAWRIWDVGFGFGPGRGV